MSEVAYEEARSRYNYEWTISQHLESDSANLITVSGIFISLLSVALALQVNLRVNVPVELVLLSIGFSIATIILALLSRRANYEININETLFFNERVTEEKKWFRTRKVKKWEFKTDGSSQTLNVDKFISADSQKLRHLFAKSYFEKTVFNKNINDKRKSRIRIANFLLLASLGLFLLVVIWPHVLGPMFSNDRANSDDNMRNVKQNGPPRENNTLFCIFCITPSASDT